MFGVLTGLAVPVEAESLSLSLEFETLDFLFFSFSCLAFCLCFARLFLNHTFLKDMELISNKKSKGMNRSSLTLAILSLNRSIFIYSEIAKKQGVEITGDG